MYIVTLSGNDLRELSELIDKHGFPYNEKLRQAKFDSKSLNELKKALNDYPDIEIIAEKEFEPMQRDDEIKGSVTDMVNKTNRFNSKPEMDFDDDIFFEKYFNTEEIESALTFYSLKHPDITEKIKLPEKTHNGRTSNLIRIGKKGFIDVYFISGVHAREWHPPDALIYFVRKICSAFKNEKDVFIGQNTFTYEQIKSIIDKLNIYVFPLVNPDGREFSQKNDINKNWRKNRRFISENIYGVDINRNYDFLWDYEKYFSSKNTDLSNMQKFNASENYIGPYPASEPETRNVISLIINTRIKYFADVHSFDNNKNLILYSWSHSGSQSDYPEMNFKNSKYWGQYGDVYYSEYVDRKDYDLRKRLAKNMAVAATKANSSVRKYQAQTSNDMYLISGGSRDYMESRNLINQDYTSIHSFFIEASGDSFFPPLRKREIIIKDIVSALFELCVQIVSTEQMKDQT